MDPSSDRQELRLAAPLGFPRSAAELDPRVDPDVLTAISRIAPGTQLRQGIDDIIRSREGALIVIGEPAELSFMFSGGIRLDQPFTPQLLYELAKMDGAIIVNSSVAKITHANVQLMPDPTIPSSETGTRHRTAERVAKQTDALVISISQQRETVTVFVDKSRYQLDAAGVAVAENSIAYDETSHSDPAADLQSLQQAASASSTDAQTVGRLPLSQVERAQLDAANTALAAYMSQSEQINADFAD